MLINNHAESGHKIHLENSGNIIQSFQKFNHQKQGFGFHQNQQLPPSWPLLDKILW
jgi:hypothetical protein